MSTKNTNDTPATMPDTEVDQKILDRITDQALKKTAEQEASALPAKIIRPKPLTVVIMAFVMVIGVLIILHSWHLWPFKSSTVTTEDSYIRGQMIVISPQVNGYITHLNVNDFQHVQKGQLLVQIDERIYLAHVAQSQGKVDNAQALLKNVEQTLAQNRAELGASQAQLSAYEAELKRATLDKNRVNRLTENGAISAREHDSVNAQYQLAQANILKGKADIQIAQERIHATEVSRESLKAQLEIAQAELQLAQIDLDNTKILAPQSGQLSEATTRQGQYVSAGSQLMFLVPSTIWVVANYKETYTAQIRKGMKATLRIDALNHQAFTGTITDIAPATGSEFSILRPDNASGNFTKVIQRLPIKIEIDANQPGIDRLRPGMSVVTSIDTAQTGFNEQTLPKN